MRHHHSSIDYFTMAVALDEEICFSDILSAAKRRFGCKNIHLILADVDNNQNLVRFSFFRDVGPHESTA